MFRTFLGDFNHQKLPLTRLRTLWEWKNRVLLEEYYTFDVAIPLEVEWKKIGGQCKIITWKTMRNKASQSHAILFQNISKFTSEYT